jgi:thioredoxin-dependent peroxiredoxin
MNKNLPKDPPQPSAKTAGGGLRGQGGATLAMGDEAPDFDLPDDAGGSVRLKDYRGQLLVLYFYPKDDTSGCTKEAIDFNGLRDDFTKARAAILGVSADSAASHAKFKAKYNLAFPLGSDASREMVAAYGVYAEKNMYGRKYMGIERTTFLIGKDGKILAIWNKVKVPGHAAAVLAAVKAQ